MPLPRVWAPIPRTPTTSCTGRMAEKPSWAIPYCCVASHHRRVHEGGYRVCSDRNGQVVFFTPEGKALFEAPPVPELPSDPVEALVRGNRERGITPDFSTGAPMWRRDSDIPWAIEAAALEALDAWDEPEMGKPEADEPEAAATCGEALSLAPVTAATGRARSC